jgi:hypothetical protein
MYCPRCKSQLKPLYNPNNPFSIEGYACFNCGKKYDKSLEKFWTGNAIKYSVVVKNLLRKKPYLDKESLKDLAIDELKTLGIDLNARRVEKLNRRIKKILNDEK